VRGHSPRLAHIPKGVLRSTERRAKPKSDVGLKPPDLTQLLIVLERQNPPVWRRAHVSAFTSWAGSIGLFKASWAGMITCRLASSLPAISTSELRLGTRSIRQENAIGVWILPFVLISHFRTGTEHRVSAGIASFGKRTSKASRIGVTRVASEARVCVRRNWGRRLTLAPLIGDSGEVCRNAKLWALRDCPRRW
jgi:hypothetical protein